MQFTFDQRRVDYIVNVLAQRPYAEVAEVLQDFATQLQQQRNVPTVAPQIAAPADRPNGAQHQEATP